MSRTYAVRLCESVRDTVRAADEDACEIALVPILAEEEMKEILGEVLREHGYEETDDGRLARAAPDGTEVVFDLELLEVVVRVEARRDVESKVTAEGLGTTEHEARRQARSELERSKAQARQRSQQAEKRLREELARALEEGEAERRRHLNEMVQEVYAEALKRKARALGDVVEVREGRTEDGEYELVIRVEA